MKYLSVKKNIALLALFTFIFSATAQNLEKQIDEIISEAYTKDEPGIALLVAKNGKTIYRKAFGKANLELDVPMKPENVFELASITKQFTAVAILMLEERGKLKIEDPITKYIPDYPTKGKIITIHHLLNHTSGIKSYTSMGLDKLARKDMTPTELIDYFKNEPMDFDPGERFQYNNSGYILLGYIIEVITKDTYKNFIENQIFKKLGMSSSQYGSMVSLVKNRASGYQKDGNGFRNADYLSLTLPYAAGSLMSTVDDMLKWQNALRNNTLIKKESLTKAINGSTLNNGEKIDYGYGLGKGEIKGSKSYQHSGGIFGYTTNGIYLIDEDVYVIALTNCSCNNVGAVTTKVAALVIGKPFPSKKDAVTLSEEKLKKWVGAYAFEGGVIRHIILKDGKLVSQREGSTTFNIYPLSDTQFIFEGGTILYYFSVDDNGKKQVKMVNTGGETIGNEIDKAPPVENKEIDVAETILKQYVGTYELQPGFYLVMTVEDGKLYTQATGQAKNQLFAKTNTRFFLKVVTADVEFIKDETGAYTSCILYQNGLELKAKRKE